MSAKDIAFARERAKFQQKINQIKLSVVKRDIQIRDLTLEIEQRNKRIEELEKQNAELLTLCKLSTEEIKQYLESKRKVASAVESFSSMIDAIEKYSL